jgi:hypothetical protein
MKGIVGFMLLVHGLIHFMGFTQAMGFGKLEQFSKEVSKPLGWLWLAGGLLFLAVALSYFLKKDAWPILAIAAVALSQTLIVMFWVDAKFGTIPNAIILVLAVIGLASIRFENAYRSDVLSRLQTTQSAGEVIGEEDLQGLPLPVREYLRYVGVVGKPKVQNFRIRFAGEMRGRGKDWFHFTSEQYSFVAPPTRLFFMEAKINGLPTAGYHAYKDQTAGMRIKLLSLFPVVDIMGPELYPTETVTYFNDLCLFAPAGLIDPRIAWEEIDDLTVKAIFSSGGTAISALLFFNEEGQLVNFRSEDRISVDEMKTFPFSTPVKNYEQVDGYKLPTYGEAIWHYPDGEFVYGKFHLKEVAYNVTQLE